MVAFSVPDVHLTGFPDGKYRVSVELTGNWAESRLQMMLGYKRIEPMAHYVTLTKEQHLVSLDFEVADGIGVSARISLGGRGHWPEDGSTRRR